MKKSIWGKIGWFFVAVLPAFLSLALQFGAAIVIMFCISIAVGFQNADAGLSQNELMQLVSEQYMNSVGSVVLVYQVIGLVVFGLWYYLAYGKKKRPQNTEKAGIKGIVIIVLAGMLLQIFISGALGVLDMLFPNLLQGYLELMETVGIGEMTPVVFIATVILAPMGEEVLCRGIIFRLAGRVSTKFWVVNCIQALAFGVIHANLVQGTYAFFLGLILGYVYGKYHNIWLCMLLHGAVNLSSNFVDIVWGALPETYMLPLVALISFLSLALLILFYRLLGKIKPVEMSEAKLPVEGADIQDAGAM